MLNLMKQHEAMLIQSVGCSNDKKYMDSSDSGIIMNHYKRINNYQGYSPICGLGLNCDTHKNLDMSRYNTTAATSVVTRTPATKPGQHLDMDISKVLGVNPEETFSENNALLTLSKQDCCPQEDFLSFIKNQNSAIYNDSRLLRNKANTPTSNNCNTPTPRILL